MIDCRELILDRAITAVATVRNITAVVMYEDCNECYITADAKNFADGVWFDLVWYFKNKDGSRPVSGKSKSGGDMYLTGYTSWEKMEELADQRVPWLFSEYFHGRGNGSGNLMKYWEYVRGNEMSLGGFIWDFVDQGRWISIYDNKTGTTYPYDYYAQDYAKETLYDSAGKFFGYGGDNGETGYHNTTGCQDGLVLPDRTLQPVMYEVKYVYQNYWFSASDDDLRNGKVKVYNESFFTDLGELRVEWSLLEDGNVIADGILSDAQAAPGETVTLDVPYLAYLPETLKAVSEYYLNMSVYNVEGTDVVPAGHELSYEQFALPFDVQRVEKEFSSENVTVDNSGSDIEVSGNDFSFTINKDTGIIENYYYNGELLMKQGPVPNYWRSVIQADWVISNSAGPAVREEHTLPTSVVYRYSYTLLPYENGEDVTELTRAYRSTPNAELTRIEVEELNDKIDALSVTDGEQLDEINSMISEYDSLTSSGKSFVGETRVYKLEEALDLAQKLADGDVTTDIIDEKLVYVENGEVIVPTDIRTEFNELNLEVGQSVNVVASAVPFYSSELSWSVEDDTVISFNNGVLNALKPGTTVLTITTDVSNIEKEIPVTVTLPDTTYENIINFIDSIEGHNTHISDLEHMLSLYNALSDEQQALVGDYRIEKLREAIDLKEKMADGTIINTADVIPDESTNKFDFVMGDHPYANLVDGALNGWGPVIENSTNSVFGGMFSGKNPFTVDVVVDLNSNGTDSNTIFSKGDSCVVMRQDNSQIIFYICESNNSKRQIAANLTNAQLNSEIRITGVYTGSQLRLYIDGVLKSSLNVGAVKDSKHPFGIGYCPTYPDARTSDIYISNIHVYSIALSDAEILRNEMTAADDNVQLWYDFDEPIVYKENRTTIEPSGIRTDVSNIQLTVGGKQKIYADAVPYYTGKVVYSVEDSSVANVSEDGTVTAKAIGQTIVTLTVEGSDLSLEIPVKVADDFDQLDITKANTVLDAYDDVCHIGTLNVAEGASVILKNGVFVIDNITGATSAISLEDANLITEADIDNYVVIDLGEKASESNTRYVQANGLTYEVNEKENKLGLIFNEETIVTVTEKDEDTLVSVAYYCVDNGVATKIDTFANALTAKPGSQLRTDENTGIRFRAGVTKDARNAENEYTIVEYGFIVAREDQLKDSGAQLNFDFKNHVSAAAYIKDDTGVVTEDHIYEELDEEIIFTGVCTNIRPKNYMSVLCARPYMKIKTSNGVHVVYGDVTSRSIYQVARAVLADPDNGLTDEALEIVRNIVKEALPDDDNVYIDFDDIL